MASEFDILRKRPLSGPLSSRSLTSESGRMKNASRNLLRKGFTAQAGQMAMGAEMAKMQEIQDRGGRSIRSADQEMTEARYALRAANAAAIQRERSQMPEAGGMPQTGGAPQAGTTTPISTATPPNQTVTTVPPPSGTDASVPPLLRRQDQGRTGAIGGVEVGDKESVIRRVMEESATSDESRRSILERINRERASVGQKPIEIDWAADVGSRDIAASDAATARKAKEAGAVVDIGAAAEKSYKPTPVPTQTAPQPAKPQPPPLLAKPSRTAPMPDYTGKAYTVKRTVPVFGASRETAVQPPLRDLLRKPKQPLPKLRM